MSEDEEIKAIDADGCVVSFNRRNIEFARSDLNGLIRVWLTDGSYHVINATHNIKKQIFKLYEY